MKRRKVKSSLERCVAWDGAFVAYAQGFVRRHGWKVKTVVGDKEDAMQECALVFSRCFTRYKYSVDNPAWFMALYKSALARHWLTLAARDVRQRPIEHDPEVQQIEHPTSPISHAWQAASEELKYVLSILSDAPSDVLQILFAGRDQDKSNERLSLWSGIKHGTPDLLGELKRLLSHGE